MNILAFLGLADTARFGRVACWLAPAVRAWWDCPAHCAVWRAAVLRRLAEFAREAAEWRDTRWAAQQELPPPNPISLKTPVAPLHQYDRPEEVASHAVSAPAPDARRLEELAREAARRLGLEGVDSPRAETGLLLAAASTFWREPPAAAYYALADRLLFGATEIPWACPAYVQASLRALTGARRRRDLAGTLECLHALGTALGDLCTEPLNTRLEFGGCLRTGWHARIALACAMNITLPMEEPAGEPLDALVRRLAAARGGAWLDGVARWLAMGAMGTPLSLRPDRMVMRDAAPLPRPV